MRYTLDGTELLESRIADDMARIRDAVLHAVGPEALTALILGGGYGRGEGGVYVVGEEERVYNDYDFFVVVPYTSRRRRKELTRRLNEVKVQMEPTCGIHVDFSPPMPLATLPHLPYELMFMEAKAGYQVIYGLENALDSLPNYDRQRPPLEEGARLFMNRGMGLYLAGKKLRELPSLDQENHEFVVRNIYKAMLAMGDGVLFIAGAYSPSYSERLENFQQQALDGIPDPTSLNAAYRDAMEFKLRPQHDVPTGMTLQEWHTAMAALYKQIFLWYEQQRLNEATLSWDAYCNLPSRLPELSATEHTKNLYRNLRTRAGRLPAWNECLLHPRDRILKRLPKMLWEEGYADEETALAIRLWERYG